MKTVAILIALLIGAGPARAQPGLVAPQLGAMLDFDGAVRPVFGVPASVTLGPRLASGVLSFACSKRQCLMKTDSALASSGGAPFAPVPAGPAIIALDGDGAFVYFPRSKQLARWSEGQLDPVPLDVPGELLSIRAGPPGTIDAAFRRGDHVWIAHISLAGAGASVTGALPDDTQLVMLIRDGVLFANRETLTLQRADGTELKFGLSGPRSAYALGDGYVEIRGTVGNYALRTDPGRERLFLLPEAAQ